jgi:hypothetical protein
MTTATRTATVTTATTSTPRPTSRSVAYAGAVAAAAGAAVLYVYGSIAEAVGGKMHAGDPGASHAVPIVASSFSMGVVFCTVLGALIAAVIVRRAQDPARTFTRAAIALTIVSLVPPLLASHTDEATRLTLAAAHVLAAAVVIPIIVRRISR